MALWATWLFAQSMQDPPTSFTHVVGRVSEIQVHTERLSKSEVKFKLTDDPDFFSYPLFFPRYYFLSERLAPGKLIDLKHRPDSRGEIWSLTLEGEIILDEKQAVSAHRRQGFISLFLAIASALAGIFCLRLWRSFRARGI